MAATMFYDDDADLSIIQNRSVAVIGYGSQGHAHALNLRDSGVDVRVGLKEGSPSREKAEAEGLRVLSVADAVEEADLIMILAPDQHQRKLYAEEIAPHLVAGDEVRGDLLGVELPLVLVGGQDHDQIGLLDGVRDGEDTQALSFGLLARRRALLETDSHIDPGVAQVQRVRVPLRAAVSYTHL